MEQNAPCFEILHPRILVQTYPFLSEIMDERGVTSLPILHPPQGSNYCVTVLHCHDIPEKMFR